MGALWELMQAVAPYAKIVEYAMVIATLVASVYASRKIKASAREIKTVMHVSSEELREEVQDILVNLKREFGDRDEQAAGGHHSAESRRPRRA